MSYRVPSTAGCPHKDNYENCKHESMKRVGLMSKILGDRKMCKGEIYDRDDGYMPKCNIFKGLDFSKVPSSPVLK